MTNHKELPRYQCHKVVRAIPIAALEANKDGSAKIVPLVDGYATFTTGEGWIDRFRGDESNLGYFVVYDDGYESWSPTKAFESGYTRINDELASAIEDDDAVRAARHIDVFGHRGKQAVYFRDVRRAVKGLIERVRALQRVSETSEPVSDGYTFRRKPTTTRAVQVRWDTWNSVCEFVGDMIGPGNPAYEISADQASDTCGEEGPTYIAFELPTAHGDMATFRHGDWVIPDSKPNTFYPCKPDVFKETYEPA